MSTMKISWGVKITFLYSAFALLIIALVIGSMRQDFDLVADDYYQQEIAYQNVLDAGKNQAALSQGIDIHANEKEVIFELPQEFQSTQINGSIHFYSPIHQDWDKVVKVENASGSLTVPRSELQNTNYKIKISWEANGTPYYQESDINLY